MRRRDGRSRERALQRLEPVARRAPGRTQQLEQRWIARGSGRRTAAQGERGDPEGGPQQWGTVLARGSSPLCPPPRIKQRWLTRSGRLSTLGRGAPAAGAEPRWRVRASTGRRTRPPCEDLPTRAVYRGRIDTGAAAL
ncbi:hypothetical protein NDU88_006703 [Pleurodeles waltl]|uniref:Uncharacterized protein n=1 Tax=Pleurodeles waltl TaxID=8319 RepID=A0AAV7PKG1_PLEWA|nr:hypothetical protein NDU88_006703 [Pleurodeles waltl]